MLLPQYRFHESETFVTLAEFIVLFVYVVFLCEICQFCFKSWSPLALWTVAASFRRLFGWSGLTLYYYRSII